MYTFPDQILEQSDDVDTVSKFFKVLRIVKIARSIRIFKLARHFESLQVLAYTLKSKMNEFGLLVMFSAMGAIAFSAIIYPLEKERWGILKTTTAMQYGIHFSVKIVNA